MLHPLVVPIIRHAVLWVVLRLGKQKLSVLTYPTSIVPPKVNCQPRPVSGGPIWIVQFPQGHGTLAKVDQLNLKSGIRFPWR